MGKGPERPNRYAGFLKRLRADGRTNMYGAIPYLVAAFGLDRNEAFRIVCEWVDAQAALAESAPATESVGRAAHAAAGGRAAPASAERAPTLFDSPPPVARREAASRAKAGKTPRGGRPRKRKPSGRKAA